MIGLQYSQQSRTGHFRALTIDIVKPSIGIGRVRGLLAPTLATLVMAAFLVGLGVWQLQRLAWKEQLVREIDERTTAAPRAPCPRAQAGPNCDRPDYGLSARLGDRDLRYHAAEIHVFRPLGKSRGPAHGIGDLVLTPLRLDDGGTVIVNRGFVPVEKLDPATRPDGQVQGRVTVTGLMREPETRNLFTPDDDPTRNQWFTRDPIAMAAFLHLRDCGALHDRPGRVRDPGWAAAGRRNGSRHPQQPPVLRPHLVRPGSGPPRVFGVFASRRLRSNGLNE